MNKIPERWLILTQYYPPEIGAPQIRLRSLARELTKHGFEIEVLTAMPNYPAGKVFSSYKRKVVMRETIDDISVRRTWIIAGTGRSAIIRLSNYFSFTLTSLIAALLGPRPDILFVESQPLSLGLVALLMKLLRGVPYIYNVPDLQIDVAQQLGFISNKSFLNFATRIENFFMRNSWKVSTVTQHFMKHFIGRGIMDEQITFLPNGADSDFLKPLPPDKKLLDRWGLAGKNMFLYVGTHAYYHGLETILEAATLLRDNKNIVFLMIGDGPERGRLIELAERRKLSNIIFDQSPYEEMDRLYSITYASIATLRNMEVSKGMRLSKIFPSLSCSVPIIYSGEGEAADLILDSGSGIVTSPENPDQLVNAILELVDKPEVRAEMGENGRRLVETEYSWSSIVSKWLDEIGYKQIAPAVRVELTHEV